MESSVSESHALGSGKEFKWETSDSKSFLAREWKPAGDAKGIILAVHGLSGAAQDFGPLGVRLREIGWLTYAPELRGQGRDPEVVRRGDLVRLQDWYNDLDSFLKWVKVRHSNLPIFLVGESMGAAVILNWLKSSTLLTGGSYSCSALQIRGMILFSPVVAVDQPVTLWQRVLFQGVSWLFPTRRVKLGDFAPKEEQDLRVTRDEAYQEYIYSASHHLESYTLRFVRHLEVLIEGCAGVCVPSEMSVLVPYAGRDVFIKGALVEKFFDRLASLDKERLHYQESFHCLLHDLEASAVLDDVERWLESRSPLKN